MPRYPSFAPRDWQREKVVPARPNPVIHSSPPHAAWESPGHGQGPEDLDLQRRRPPHPARPCEKESGPTQSCKTRSRSLAGRLLNEAALSEAPRQFMMDFARRNVVITQRHEQMEQEIRRLMNDLLSLLPFGGQNHFACLLGDFLEDCILPCLEERCHVGIRRRKPLALEDRLINPF